MTTATSAVVEHADCVQAATTEVLTGTCGLQLAAADGLGLGEPIIMAVISLVGDVEWTVFLNMSRQTAAALATRFSGMEIAPESGDLPDAIGELANILGGTVKAQLDRRKIGVNLSLPSVLEAADVEVMVPWHLPTVKTHYKTELGVLCTGVIVGKKHGEQ